MSDVESYLDIDQRENARREREGARIGKLTGPAKTLAQEVEGLAVQKFEFERQKRSSPLPPLLEPGHSPGDRRTIDGISDHQLVRGRYGCNFDGCSAPPFHTYWRWENGSLRRLN